MTDNANLNSEASDGGIAIAGENIRDISITQIQQRIEELQGKISNLRDQRRDLARFIKSINYQDSLVSWNFEGIMFQLSLLAVLFGCAIVTFPTIGTLLFFIAVAYITYQRIMLYRKRVKNRKMTTRGTELISQIDEEIEELSARYDTYLAEAKARTA